MKTLMNSILTVIVLCASTSMSAMALTSDGVLDMAKKGVGEEVQLAAVLKANTEFDLPTEQIIALKKAGVSDRVLAAMLRQKKDSSVQEASAAASIPSAPLNEPKAGAAGGVGTANKGTLNLENVDSKAWGYRFDSGTGILWIQPVDEENSSLMNPHGGVSLSVPSGSYKIQYSGEREGKAFQIKPDVKTLVLISRVETQEFEGIYVSIFEKGERRDGGRLATLRQTKSRALPQASYQYTSPPKVTEQPQERVVTNPRVIVEQPTTTVIYRTAPVYSYPYCGYPYSYGIGHRYYPYNYGGFRYHHGHRHSGFSIGFGFGR